MYCGTVWLVDVIEWQIFKISFPDLPEEEHKKMAVQREKLYRSTSM